MMTPEEIKKKVLEYDWRWWLGRQFGAFIQSLFIGGNSRSAMRRVGADVEWPVALFQERSWYESEKAYHEFDAELAREIPRRLELPG